MTADDILTRLKDKDTNAEELLEACSDIHHKLHLRELAVFQRFTNILTKQGRPTRAYEVANDGLSAFPTDITLKYERAAAAKRGGNPRFAETLLKPLLPAARTDATIPLSLRVDILALQGGILKDLSRNDPKLVAPAAEVYQQAAELPGAAESSDRGTFPLINAATLWRIAEDSERSQSLATEVIRRLDTIANGDAVWHPASYGEAYLLLGRHDQATQEYLQAVHAAEAANRLGDLVSIRGNIERLRIAGLTADVSFLDTHLGSVIVFSGHMVDSPDRLAKGHPVRFPNTPKLTDAVSAAITAKLEALNAKVGYCSLACGGDILFAKAMLARKAELHIVLPHAVHDFLRTSVNFGQEARHWSRWRKDFDEVIHAVPEANVQYTTREPYLGSNDLYDFSNHVLQGLAVMRAKQRASVPQALLLIDRLLPGLPGGATSFGVAWNEAEYAVHEVPLRAIRDTVNEPIPAMAEKPATPVATSVIPRRVKMMLFADLAGFSTIEEWRQADFLLAFTDYLKRLFASSVGQTATYLNTWGDGVHAVFDEVSAATAFALELVEPRQVSQPEWAAFGLGDTVPFRVGLHAGPVFELKDYFRDQQVAYYGQHVNRAARIEPATMQGCVYASEPFAALLTMANANRFHIEAVGVQSLAKDYDRCPLYHVSRATNPSRSSGTP